MTKWTDLTHAEITAIMRRKVLATLISQQREYKHIAKDRWKHGDMIGAVSWARWAAQSHNEALQCAQGAPLSRFITWVDG